jgi:hypothetical protein
MTLIHRRRRRTSSGFCNTCGQVCDESCRREAITERNVVSALRRLGPRL